LYIFYTFKDHISSPKNSHNSEKLRDSAHFRQLSDGCDGIDQGDGGEIRQNGQEIDNIHWTLDELHFAWTTHQTNLKKDQIIEKNTISNKLRVEWKLTFKLSVAIILMIIIKLLFKKQLTFKKM